MLNDLNSQINQIRGVEVANNFPLGPLLQNTCLIQGADLTARAALRQFLEQIEAPQQNPISRFRYCWSLMHDANADMYFLAFYAVIQPSDETPASDLTVPAPPKPSPNPGALPGSPYGNLLTRASTVPPRARMPKRFVRADKKPPTGSMTKNRAMLSNPAVMPR